MRVHTYGHLPDEDPILATVDVETLRRLPSVTIVGLPTARYREVAEWARSALVAVGVEWPRMRVVATFTPVAPRDRGRPLPRYPHAAAAVAVAVAHAIGEAPALRRYSDIVVAGGLTLGGDLRLDSPSNVAVGCPPSMTAIVPPGVAFPGPRVEIESLAALRGPVPLKTLPGPLPPSRTVGAAVVAVAPGVSAVGVTRAIAAALPWSPDNAVAAGRRFAAASFAAEPLESPPIRAPHHTVSIAGCRAELYLSTGGVFLASDWDEWGEAQKGMILVAAREGRTFRTLVVETADLTGLPDNVRWVRPVA